MSGVLRYSTNQGDLEIGEHNEIVISASEPTWVRLRDNQGRAFFSTIVTPQCSARIVDINVLRSLIASSSELELTLSSRLLSKETSPSSPKSTNA